MIRVPRVPARRPAWSAFLLLALATAAALSAGPFDSWREYTVQGSGTIEVDRYHLRGFFSAAYQIDADNRVLLTSFSAGTRDRDIVIRFGRREVERIALRCSRVRATHRAPGIVDPATGNIVFAPGSVHLSGISYSERGRGGRCPGTGSAMVISATNDGLLELTHAPSANEVRLAGDFTAIHDGETYDVEFALDGRFVNRPPVAELGVEGEHLPPVIQGGCPPLSGLNPPATEANDPAGLRITLQSNSHDLDGDWPRADIAKEQWSHSREGGLFRHLGTGRRIESRVFEFGPEHSLLLRVTDRRGAEDRTGCTFRVLDRLPPELTVPRRTEIPCTLAGGATPRSSRPLQQFLAAARAIDRGDSRPVVLPPQVGGLEVGADDLFPLGVYTPVTFRARDRWGNEAVRSSGVTVIDKRGPRLEVDLGHRYLEPHGRFVPVRPRIEAGDACGDVRVILESIGAEDGVVDPADYRAAFGSEDLRFQLRALPAPRADTRVERVYLITFLATDSAGNETRVVKKLPVRARPQR